ncbi:carbohydrate binding domain-containing protein [Paramicrobacterium agarici]|uniref:Alpha-amylase n=1 Tax=Paramicrobacterium agarici TaxID=630514 RepID=A0A2A9DSR8_9MICO|nr:carbohydrate binding domain-containing protein [Microbacterium agarici]PFG29411.1 fibronectin type III domain protein [Microbacterium agarici]
MSTVSQIDLPQPGRRRRLPLVTLTVGLLIAGLLVAITPPQKADAAAPGPKDVIAVMFSWTWNAIARECTNTLGPAGYGYVQTSPPQEHVTGSQWWTYYQPVSYKLESRLGTAEEFKDMIATCNAAGVEVIVDAVINHMSGDSDGGTGWAGSSYGHYNYPGLYSDNDFHDCRRDIQNYQDRWEVQNCNLVNLADLDTSSDYVQQTIADYLNHLVDLGAAGFRIDAVKHIAADDLRGIMSRVENKDDLYIVQEVIRANEPIQPEEYLGMGDIHEFAYARKLKEAFGGGTIDWLISGNGIGETWDGFLDHDDAGVFVDNHDTERNGQTLSYKDGDVYDLAQIFTLAWNYGSPSIQSGFTFNNFDAGPPQTASGEVIDPTCGNGSVWTCEHAENEIVNMVGFRTETYGTDVTKKWTNGSNAIAFSRGDKGTVAINRGGSELTRTFETGLPDGTYYNVISATRNGETWSGDTVTVSGGQFTATVPSNGAVAIHAGAKAGAGCEDTAAPSAPQNVEAAADGTNVSVSWTASTDDCAVTGYTITRTGGEQGETTLTAPGSSTSIADSGLDPDTEYSYTVTATDGSNESEPSSPASVTTGEKSPDAAAEVFYKANGSWRDYYIHYQVGDGEWTSVPGEQLQQRCDGWYGATIPLGDADGLTAAFNDGAGTWDNNGKQNYALGAGVQVVDDGQITTTDPCAEPPTGDMTLFYSADAGWDAYYAHYRVGDGEWTTVPGVAMEQACDGWYSVTVADGASGTTFAFNNGAGTWDNNGKQDYRVSGSVVTVASGQVSGTAPCDLPSTAPTTPTDVSLSADDGAVTVTWSASTAESGIASYTVTRTGGAEGEVSTVVDDTTFVDTTVSESTTYSYTVTATAEDGSVSLASDAAEITTPGTTGGDDTEKPSTPAGLSITVDGDTVHLSWDAATDNVGVAGYRVIKAGGGEATLGIVTTATEIGFYNLTPDEEYLFKVQAMDAAGNLSGWSEIVSTQTDAGEDTQAPGVPTGVTATVDGTSVTLTWTPSTDDTAVASYTVRIDDGAATSEKTAAGPSITIDNLDADTAYAFTVQAADSSGNVSDWSEAVSATTAGGDPGDPGEPTGTDYSDGYYQQNSEGNVGSAAEVTVDGDASEWTADMVIAQGVANDDPRIFRGSHEGPVYDLYSLSSAWDDDNLYLMWQFTNVTDVVDPAQSYPISDNGKPYNGDIPQALAFDVNADGGTGLVDGTEKGVWGIRTTFSNQEVDHLAMFSSKPGVGQPAMFSLNGSGAFDYEPENAVGFDEAAISYAYGDGFCGESLMGIDANGYEGYTPADLSDASSFIDFLDTAHDTAQDTVYEMAIPFAALGTTRDAVEANGIGVMLLSTFGQSAIGSLPQDPATLDVALEPYSADSSTSAEKEDWDPMTAQFARIGA